MASFVCHLCCSRKQVSRWMMKREINGGTEGSRRELTRRRARGGNIRARLVESVGTCNKTSRARGSAQPSQERKRAGRESRE